MSAPSHPGSRAVGPDTVWVGYQDGPGTLWLHIICCVQAPGLDLVRASMDCRLGELALGTLLPRVLSSEIDCFSWSENS